MPSEASMRRHCCPEGKGGQQVTVHMLWVQMCGSAACTPHHSWHLTCKMLRTATSIHTSDRFVRGTPTCSRAHAATRISLVLTASPRAAWAALQRLPQAECRSHRARGPSLRSQMCTRTQPPDDAHRVRKPALQLMWDSRPPDTIASCCRHPVHEQRRQSATQHGEPRCLKKRRPPLSMS